jgi:hypothetical protein
VEAKKMHCPTCGHDMHNNTNLTADPDKIPDKGKLEEEGVRFHSELINKLVGDLDMTV